MFLTKLPIITRFFLQICFSKINMVFYKPFGQSYGVPATKEFCKQKYCGHIVELNNFLNYKTQRAKNNVYNLSTL